MKDYIQAHYRKVHSLYKKAKEAIQEAWESISHERIKELVYSMKARCQAVIDAEGGPTRYLVKQHRQASPLHLELLPILRSKLGNS